MAHDHAHHHARGSHAQHGALAGRRLSRAFALGVGLNLAFVAAEAAAGFLGGSLALLADAGHNLGDVASLLLAWGAALLARRAPTPARTYGLGRATVLAALANALLLLVAVGAIAWEAVRRLAEGGTAAGGGLVMAVAGAGIVVNGVTALLFAKGRHGDLNLRGAFQHMAGDTAISAGVVLGGLVIAETGWAWVDPAVSLAVAAAIGAASWGLLSASVHLAMDGVPERIDRGAVERYLAGLAGVAEVHDLHIWGLSTTDVALTAHLVIPGAATDDRFLADVAEALHDRFGIAHATIQVECGGGPECRLAPEGTV